MIFHGGCHSLWDHLSFCKGALRMHLWIPVAPLLPARWECRVAQSVSQRQSTFDSDFIARWTSCSVGGIASARLVFVGHCGISDKTDASKVVGWINTESKCSIQRFMISDCFVSRVVPYLLRIGVVSPWFGPKTAWGCGKTISCRVYLQLQSSEAIFAHHASFVVRSSRWVIFSCLFVWRLLSNRVLVTDPR